MSDIFLNFLFKLLAFVLELREVCLDIVNRMIYYTYDKTGEGVYKRRMDLSDSASVLTGTTSMRSSDCSYGYETGYVRKAMERRYQQSTFCNTNYKIRNISVS